MSILEFPHYDETNCCYFEFNEQSYLFCDCSIDENDPYYQNYCAYRKEHEEIDCSVDENVEYFTTSVNDASIERNLLDDDIIGESTEEIETYMSEDERENINQTIELNEINQSDSTNEYEPNNTNMNINVNQTENYQEISLNQSIIMKLCQPIQRTTTSQKKVGNIQ